MAKEKLVVTDEEKKAAQKQEFLDKLVSKKQEVATFVEDVEYLSQFEDGFFLEVFCDDKLRKYYAGSLTSQTGKGKFAVSKSKDAVNVGEALDVLADAEGVEELSEVKLAQWVWAAKNWETDAKAYSKFLKAENAYVFDTKLFLAAATMAAVAQ